MSRNGVKYRWTESNLGLFPNHPRCFPTTSALRACQLDCYEVYLHKGSPKYKHTGICDCKFSKHDGLETYIVPVPMFTTRDRCSQSGACISFLFRSGTTNVNQWPTNNTICYELTAVHVRFSNFVILMAIINMIGFCAIKCHSRKCPTAW